jgi:FtsH-binding integral membrane protein
MVIAVLFSLTTLFIHIGLSCVGADSLKKDMKALGRVAILAGLFAFVSGNGLVMSMTYGSFFDLSVAASLMIIAGVGVLISTLITFIKVDLHKFR